MTKTVTHLDLDDVLTSIRRLVSVPAESGGSTQQTPAPLVLKPIFRVHENPTTDTLDLNSAPELIEDISRDELDISRDDISGKADAESSDSLSSVLELTALHAVDPEKDEVENRIEVTAPNTETEQANVQFAEQGEGSLSSESPIGGSDRPAFAESSPQPSRTNLEERIAELERAVGGADEQFEPDGSEPQEQHQPKLHFLERYRERFGEPEHIETGSADNAPAEAISQKDKNPTEQTADEVQSPQQVAAITEDTQNVEEPADKESVDALRQTIISNLAERLTRDEELDAVQETETPASPKDETKEVAVFMRSRDASGIADQPANAQTPLIDDLPKEIPEGETEQAVVPQSAPVELVTNDEEFLVDEETLRSVVADIVKDELQGRLGERITRNVRRMVRQEIERAISLKSLE